MSKQVRAKAVHGRRGKEVRDAVRDRRALGGRHTAHRPAADLGVRLAPRSVDERGGV